MLLKAFSVDERPFLGGDGQGSKRVKQLPCEEMMYYSYITNTTRKLPTIDSRFHCSACVRV